MTEEDPLLSLSALHAAFPSFSIANNNHGSWGSWDGSEREEEEEKQGVRIPASINQTQWSRTELAKMGNSPKTWLGKNSSQ